MKTVDVKKSWTKNNVELNLHKNWQIDNCVFTTIRNYSNRKCVSNREEIEEMQEYEEIVKLIDEGEDIDLLLCFLYEIYDTYFTIKLVEINFESYTKNFKP